MTSDLDGGRSGGATGAPGFDLNRLLTLYYGVGTLVFWGIDMVLAAPIRASFIGRPGLRIGYYLALLALAALCRWRPTAAPLVGIAESSVNLLLVMMSILMPVWGLTDQALAGGELGLPFTTWTLLNALLSGLVFVYTFHRSRSALERQIARSRSGTG